MTVDGVETTKTWSEQYKDSRDMCVSEVDYYFNTATGKVDYMYIADGTDEKKMVTVKQDVTLVKPAWFDKAEIVEDKENALFGELMMVIFLPMMDEPLTKESLEEEMELGISMQFGTDGSDTEITVDTPNETDSDTTEDTETEPKK